MRCLSLAMQLYQELDKKPLANMSNEEGELGFALIEYLQL